MGAWPPIQCGLAARLSTRKGCNTILPKPENWFAPRPGLEPGFPHLSRFRPGHLDYLTEYVRVLPLNERELCRLYQVLLYTSLAPTPRGTAGLSWYRWDSNPQQGFLRLCLLHPF